MRYRVVFRERTDREGNPTERPPDFLAPQLSDGIVMDATIVERTSPQALHTDSFEEDDDFLSLETEVWDYDVADDRKQDFEDALRNSGMVIEFEALGDEDSVNTV